MSIAAPHTDGPRSKRGLSIDLATSGDDIKAAQRLRYAVFCGELGARLTGRVPGRDEDMFDPWCEHLIVRDHDRDRIVGTYRILTADRAKRLGTFYSEGHFDLTRIAALKSGMMEIGRACIHRDHRKGPALMLLWQGIHSFMRERGYSYLIGCASIGMGDGGANAMRIYELTAPRHLAPIEYRVRPRNVLLRPDQVTPLAAGRLPALPPLLKGHLRIGAWIGGEPAWDPEFDTADLFLFMPLARVETRYARHYLRAAT